MLVGIKNQTAVSKITFSGGLTQPNLWQNIKNKNYSIAIRQSEAKRSLLEHSGCRSPCHVRQHAFRLMGMYGNFERHCSSVSNALPCSSGRQWMVRQGNPRGGRGRRINEEATSITFDWNGEETNKQRTVTNIKSLQSDDYTHACCRSGWTLARESVSLPLLVAIRL